MAPISERSRHANFVCKNRNFVNYLKILIAIECYDFRMTLRKYESLRSFINDVTYFWTIFDLLLSKVTFLGHWLSAVITKSSIHSLVDKPLDLSTRFVRVRRLFQRQLKLPKYPPINLALLIFSTFISQQVSTLTPGEFTFWTDLNNHTTKQLMKWN